MPERTGDNNGLWAYTTVYPGADLKLNPNAVQQPSLVEATGLDGRFVGALRPFPGMGGVTIHGVPTPSGSTTVTSITNVVFAKYVSVQKGLSRHIFKGIAYVADNPGGTGKALYFAYRDSSNGSTDVLMLEDFAAWTDFELTSYDDYDITSQGRYIYLCMVGTTTSGVPSFNNNQAPYNKAYFWDWRINSWDNFVSGFDNRFMSAFPRRLLATPINEDSTTGGLDSSDVMRTEVYSPPGTESDMPAGDYTYMVQLVSKKHGLRSYARMHTGDPGPLAALRYRVSGINPPTNYSAFVQQIRGNSTEVTHVIQWGIPHFDGFRLFRTALNDLGMPTNSYAPVLTLHEIDNYIELGNYDSSSGTVTVEIDHDIDPAVLGDLSSTVFSDEALFSQPQYDPFLDDFGPAPRLKRIASYDGLLVGVCDVSEPSTYSIELQANETSPESICWSILSKEEPENFPPENYYRMDEPAERGFALVPAGDHLFETTNSSVYRISRSGGTLIINRLATGTGALSRYGATGAGQSLFLVTRSGLKEIDGNTGEVRSVTSFDRVFLDDSEWAPSLANVAIEYDAALGALILLNTTTHECYFLWEMTGAITKLVDVPWVRLTSGPDVLTDGPRRVYFVTSTAQVHVVDAARQMGKRSMCGAGAPETVNGTVTSISSTNLIDSTATFPVNCVGFKVYILSGARDGESATITARGSATNLSVSGLSGALAVGDRYSVAPIVTRITLPQIPGQGEIDPFVRKVAKSISVAFSDLAGESSGTNGTVRMGLKQNETILGTLTESSINLVPDQVVGSFGSRTGLATTRAYPYLEFLGGNLDYEIQAVLVKGVLSMSEAQSRQG